MGIGHIKHNERKFDEAFDDYCRAVAILEEFHPTNHILIAINLEWIGIILNQKSLYSCAIEYLEKCLRIKEASLPPKHLSIALTVSNLGQVQ
jgi:hypothetical protein